MFVFFFSSFFHKKQKLKFHIQNHTTHKYNMTFKQMRAFYKGWSCPAVMAELSDESWERLCKKWDDLMISMLKADMNLQELGDYCIQQMDMYIKFFTEHSELCCKDKLKQLQEQCKTVLEADLSSIQMMWYGNVYMLLKLKRIENDNDNGWLGIKTW